MPLPSVSIAVKIQEYWTSIFEVGMLVSLCWVLHLCNMLARNVPRCWKLQSTKSSFSVNYTTIHQGFFMLFTDIEPESHGMFDSMPSLTFWHHVSWFTEVKIIVHLTKLIGTLNIRKALIGIRFTHCKLTESTFSSKVLKMDSTQSSSK